MARHTTKVIYANVPSNLSTTDKNSNSSKSLCQGNVNILAMNPDMGFLQAIMRTGHSAESSFDPYLDQRNPLCRVTAMNALHRNSTRAEVILPNILSVGPGDIRSICSLVDHMFPSITVPEFKASGSLYSAVLETCAASLV